MFAVLTQGRRLALPRHQTLRATLAWGYDLLSPVEQAVLRRIAIFRVTFTLESALAVVVDPAVPVEKAIDAMANLVAKSLLSVDSTGGIALYRLLEATGQYAAAQLARSDERSQIARRHAEHHSMLIETAPADLQSEAGRQWLLRHAGRIDDIRAALDWTLSQGGDLSIGLSLTANSIRLWLHLSLTLEYVERIERALQRLPELPQPDPVVEMRLQIAFGYAIWYSASRRDRLEFVFARALELADRVGDAPSRLHALWGMWAVRRARGEYREALAVAESYEAVARTAGDRAAVHSRRQDSRADAPLSRQPGDGPTGAGTGAQDRAPDRRRPCRRLPARVRGGGPGLAGRILWLQGFPDRAMAALQETIDAAQRSDHWFSLYYTLCLAGCPLALWTGDLAQTQAYLDMMTNRAADDRWKRCWALMLRLRQGGARDRLIASFLEPQVDLLTSAKISALAPLPVIPLPQPDEDVGAALWSLPEILRVNAELLLWQDGPDAAPAAEQQLLRSLEVARQQSTLSWELRAATSLARLWHRGGRVAAARDLLAATSDRFTEGFGTADVVTARRLIAEWS